MANKSTLNVIATEVGKAIAPIQTYFTSLEDFTIFMKQLGWDLSVIPTPISSLMSDVNAMIAQLNTVIGGEAELQDYEQLINTVSALTQDIRNLVNSSFDPILTLEQFAQTFPKQLLDHILIVYLNDNQYMISGFLELLGIITYTPKAPTTNRPAYILKEIRWQRIANLFSDPQHFFQDVYGWGTMNFDSGALFRNLTKVFGSFGFYPTLQLGSQQLMHDLVPSPSILKKNQYVLNFSLFSLVQNNVSLEGNFQLLYLPAIGASLPGLGLMPVVKGGFQKDLEIAKNLLLSISANLDIAGGIVLVKRPQEPFTVKTGFGQGSMSTITGNFDVALINKAKEPTLIFGSSDGSRLEYASLSTGLSLEVNSQAKNEIKFEIQLKGLKLVIDKGQSDSFINKMLPEGGITVECDLVLGYSNLRGFYFQGSGGLEFKLPIHFKLGPVEIDNVLLSLKYANNLQITTTADFNFNLGAVAAYVKNIGMRGTLSIGNGGNIGGADFKLGFKPPTGIGLSIDASAVKGGGFLNYDEDTWTYTGGLELAFSKISFSAIGILSTKLPGGKPGYSLLIIISAEFTPIQLGMGFTLNGIGGILGLNRTMNPDVLRNGIRDNTLDSILFPKDIVKNANTIISNIGQAFPTKEGQFLVGPMAKIGWGTPTLLTIELGIIIELPEPVRLAILGVIKALLPSKDNAIIKIQVNFLGIIDFTNKYLSFDASLYDSQILTFGLFGDMALRLYWGDKPNFLLSVGGFHPKFTPPPLNLPPLRRLTIVLANQNNLKISVETYFALTSNSVQFGAKVAAMAKAWKIQAIGALWFDILFQFSPFYFIADMGVMFAIKMGSKTILSLYVNLTLEGPNPWRARGKGSFKVLFVRVNVSFDKTFGQARVEAIQAEAIDAKVKAALTNRDNWEAFLPDRSHQLVSFREEDLSNPNTELSVDPAGTLKISQRLIPLTTTMAKFGSSAISDFKRYDVTDVKAGSDSLPRKTVQDYFARNEFFYMKDDEKLSRPSYELFDSGLIAGADRIDSQYAVHTKCHYEEITLDSGYRRPEPIYFLPLAQFRLHAFGNYVSRSGLSSFDRITTSAGPNRVKVDLQQEQFVLINRNDMSQVSGYFSNSAEAERQLAVEMASAPATAADWIVANRFEL